LSTEPVQALRFLEHRAQQVAPALPRQALRLPCRAASNVAPMMLASGVRKSCEIDDSRILRSFSEATCVSAACAACASRTRSIATAAWVTNDSSSASARDLELARILRAQAEHADAALERIQRQIDPHRRCASVSVLRPAFCGGHRPIGNAQVVARNRITRQARARSAARAEVGRVEQRPRCLAAARRLRRRRSQAQCRHRNRAEFAEVAILREFPAQRVEFAAAAFALACHRRLPAAARGEIADDQAGSEHDGKRDQVLRIRHRERIDRLHEQEIEQDHAQHAGNDRGPAPETDCHEHRAEQIEHDQVRALDVS
jgi:hypothetical protein